MISEHKNMKNKANFKDPNLTATYYGTVGYNVSHPKTQNGTNPNKANLKPISNTIKPSLLLGEPSFSRNLFLRNEPNFNYSNIIATSYITVIYNALQTKLQNGTNPNEPNFFTTSKPHFSAKLFSDTRLPQGPPAGCKNGDWLVPAEGRVVPVPFFATAVKRSNRSKEPQKRKKTLKVKTKT